MSSAPPSSGVYIFKAAVGHVVSDEKAKGDHMPDCVRSILLYLPQLNSICSQCKKYLRFPVISQRKLSGRAWAEG